MNFSSPSDFLFVSGDLDKIVIDNEIMPLRTGIDREHLRGMDIAFLMEAVEERARQKGLPGKTHAFTVDLSADQVNDIIDRYNDIVADEADDFIPATTGAVCWVDTDALDEEMPSDTFCVGVLRKCRRKLTELSRMSDGELLADKVEELFDAIGALNTLSKNVIDLHPIISYQTSEIVVLNSGHNVSDVISNIKTNIEGSGHLSYECVKNPDPFGREKTAEVYGYATSARIENLDFGLTDYDKGLYKNSAMFDIYLVTEESKNETRYFELVDGMVQEQTVLDYIERRMETFPKRVSGEHAGAYYFYLDDCMPIVSLRDRTRWDV